MPRKRGGGGADDKANEGADDPNARRGHSLLFAELTRTDLAAIAPRALAIVPVGATEQHGPHLRRYGFFHAEWVTREAATQAAQQIPLVVTPTLPFGSSEHHFPFGGTISLPTTTYYDVVTSIVESLVRDGFRHVYVVNGHGGNHELIQLVARDIALRLPVAVGACSWWAAGWDVMVEAGAHQVGRLPRPRWGLRNVPRDGDAAGARGSRPVAGAGADPLAARRALSAADPRGTCRVLAFHRWLLRRAPAGERRWRPALAGGRRRGACPAVHRLP